MTKTAEREKKNVKMIRSHQFSVEMKSNVKEKILKIKIIRKKDCDALRLFG